MSKPNKKTKNHKMIPAKLFVPAESLEYPIWDLVDKCRENELESKIDFRGSYISLRNMNENYPGLPREFDFRVYMVLMRWSNLYHVYNNTFPDKLTFPLKELRNKIVQGRGGRQNQEIVNALHRLLNTLVETDVKLDDRKRHLSSFHLLSAVKIEEVNNELICTVGFPPEFVFETFVIEDDKPAIMLETEKLDKITKSSSKLAYARLQKHLESAKKRKQNRVTRLYSFIINEIFTGWKKHTVLSYVKRQLTPSLNELVKAGIIIGYDIYKGQRWDKKGEPVSKPAKNDSQIRIDFTLRKSEIKQSGRKPSEETKYKKMNKEYEKHWEKLAEEEKERLTQIAIKRAKENYQLETNDFENSRIFKAYIKIELKKLLGLYS